ncbi:hypothetical protein [Winogradskyella sp. SYSU M77433]|uniref:hypothetical protein n=1 Tax=Winogradskyella sp. SYSU M77433 TaxID=3042722 RepID=UPI00247FEBE0|nr:hypothetical protein [Winogradskyella sp. SYSU M77433]MDH7913359.1 hypothetical protein [Winogradskyella sp. SYSU M77433]
MKPYLSILIVLFLCFSCSKKDYEINLKWNKAYPEDTFERNITGLKWAFSYLGSTIANDSTLIKFNPKDSIVSLDVRTLGFSEDASSKLAKLQYLFKKTEYYKQHNAFDLGRYVTLTFGTSSHYYAITDVSETLKDFNEDYQFLETKGYIDNSSISNVHRIISFTDILENNRQAFISAEIDSITKDTLEYETTERMPNGQLKFGIYDIKGNIKYAANSNLTRAGTHAKCIWCHEVVVQPLFKTQKNYNNYLDYFKLDDTLVYFNQKLQKYQNTLWKDKSLKNKKLHTELELVYISFMEPSGERISREWNMPLKEVENKLSGLETHIYEEFPFLGNLYHRKDIDSLSPFKVIEVPESIREKSSNTINLLK